MQGQQNIHLLVPGCVPPLRKFIWRIQGDIHSQGQVLKGAGTWREFWKTPQPLPRNQRTTVDPSWEFSVELMSEWEHTERVS
jgi:hypothetical protein